jgi:hypothetical protein
MPPRRLLTGTFYNAGWIIRTAPNFHGLRVSRTAHDTLFGRLNTQKKPYNGNNFPDIP